MNESEFNEEINEINNLFDALISQITDQTKEEKP